jgi:hypothetical protein
MGYPSLARRVTALAVLEREQFQSIGKMCDPLPETALMRSQSNERRFAVFLSAFKERTQDQ